MALYSYQALNRTGKQENGTIDATSISHAQELLVRRGLYPISITSSTNTHASKSWWKQLFIKKVSLKDKILFTKQLAVLLKSGVPLLQSLELLSDQFEGQLQTILITLKDNIKEGKSLADGMNQYKNVFDTIYVQLVRAGEATGKLEIILERLTQFLERREALGKKISGALMLPLIQLSIVFAVVILLLTFVVPQLAGTFAKQGKELPFSTRSLLALSNYITGHYILIIGFIISTLCAFILWKRTTKGAITLDRIKLKLPLIGYFARTGAIVQFCRTLGMLLESGVNLSQALDIVCNIINNKIIATELLAARDNIIKQGKIAQYLKQTGVFPPIAIYLINTGEQSGNLDTMLLTVADNYEVELTELTDGLAEKLNPIMLVVMGVLVGFIVLSIAQPLFEMGTLVK
jgi:type II secretory pathway component PulF